jgi:hypothetical protein
MDSEIATVIREVTKLPDVSRAWIEWKLESDGQRTKTLVVEVTFHTDPNSSKFRPSALDEIEASIKDTLTNKTTMVISDARVVPSGLY